MLAAVIVVLALTGGPNSHGGTVACVTANDVGPDDVAGGVGEGFEQDTATTTTNNAHNPSSERVVSFAFIFAFFPSLNGKHKCRCGVDLVAVKSKQLHT
jgi:hypothetical protein